MVEEEDDQFIKENKNKKIFNKYIVIKKLREGSFGDVYLGQRIDKKYVAIKLEPRKIDYSLLEMEAFLLYSIHGVGIPSIYYIYDFYIREVHLAAFFIIINDRKNFTYEEQYKFIKRYFYIIIK